ncbi:unnamed protein product, partial [Didymodactylos carnosus]
KSALKGGTKINEYLTYNCLSSENEHWSDYAGPMQKHFVCQYCNEDLLLDLAERILHENECQIRSLTNNDDSLFKSDKVDSQVDPLKNESSTKIIPPTAKDYYCDICLETFKLTSIEILRHRTTHQS